MYCLQHQNWLKRRALPARHDLKNVKTLLIPTSSLRHTTGYGQERVD